MAPGVIHRRFLFFDRYSSIENMVVRMRSTRSHTGNRRSHHALSTPALISCECGAMRSKHHMCSACGRYRGRVIVDVAAKAVRKAARRAPVEEKGKATKAK